MVHVVSICICSESDMILHHSSHPRWSPEGPWGWRAPPHRRSSLQLWGWTPGGSGSGSTSLHPPAPHYISHHRSPPGHLCARSRGSSLGRSRMRCTPARQADHRWRPPPISALPQAELQDIVDAHTGNEIMFLVLWCLHHVCWGSFGNIMCPFGIFSVVSCNLEIAAMNLKTT